jgi:hypothetical protein
MGPGCWLRQRVSGMGANPLACSGGGPFSAGKGLARHLGQPDANRRDASAYAPLWRVRLAGPVWEGIRSTIGRARSRICYKSQKVNLSQAFAGQDVGVKQVSDHIWLVTFMDYDLGYFDDETCRLEPIENPFGPKVLPMSPE